MRKKLRKIVVNEEVYLYTVSHNDDEMTRESVIVKVFREGSKNTPLYLNFDVIFPLSYSESGGYQITESNPFIDGLKLTHRKTGIKENVNIHTPGWVSKYIDYAIIKGWDATKTERWDGVEILSEWGFDVTFLHHYVWDSENQRTIIENYK